MVCYTSLYYVLLTVTLQVVLRCVSIGESYSHQFSEISIMLLRAMQWNLCIMNTVEPFISVQVVLIIQFSLHVTAPFETITNRLYVDYAGVLIF